MLLNPLDMYSDAPDICELNGCDNPVDYCVRYRDPEEKVYYCSGCSDTMYERLEKAISRTLL